MYWNGFGKKIWPGFGSCTSHKFASHTLSKTISCFFNCRHGDEAWGVRLRQSRNQSVFKVVVLRKSRAKLWYGTKCRQIEVSRLRGHFEDSSKTLWFDHILAIIWEILSKLGRFSEPSFVVFYSLVQVTLANKITYFYLTRKFPQNTVLHWGTKTSKKINIIMSITGATGAAWSIFDGGNGTCFQQKWVLSSGVTNIKLH